MPADPESKPRPSGSKPDTLIKTGIVCTFYSFKGGVGRSMAVANVAAILARLGQRVLLLDWDLEAPGLERFFGAHVQGSRRETPGLVDLVSAYRSEENLSWKSCLLTSAIPQGQTIHILHAGRDDAAYLEKLSAIRWDVLFEQGFGRCLEDMRTEWIKEYDYVLVDSRTGITDVGGICSILLPDYLISMFTTTDSSLLGVKNTMLKARTVHADLPLNRRRLVIIPIAARDESGREYERAAQWRKKFARELAEFYNVWVDKAETPESVLDYLKIPYVAYWSFGEPLPVLEEDPTNPKNLAYSYALIARLVHGRLDWSEVQEGRKAIEAAAAQYAETQARESEKLRSEKEALEIELKKSRRRTYTRFAAALSAVILVLSLTAFSAFTLWEQRQAAVAAAHEAQVQRDSAMRATMEAETQRNEAEAQKALADEARQRAEMEVARAKEASADLRKAEEKLKETQIGLENAEAQVAELKAQLQRAQAALRVLEVRGRANSPIFNATVTPGGQAFATLQGDGVTLWDASAGAKIREYDTGLKTGQKNYSTAVTTSPNGAFVLATSFDGAALLWEVDRSAPKVAFRMAGKVISAQFSPDGTRVLTASDDGAAQIWDTASGKEIATLRAEAGPLLSATFSPDGKRVLTLGERAMRLWDAATEKKIWDFDIEAGGRGSPGFSPDGTRIVVPSGNAAQIVDSAGGRRIAVLDAESRVNSAQFSPDGRRIVIGSDDKTARIFDAGTGEQLIVMQGHTGAITSAAFSPDGTRVLTAR